jgi:hypothetical protein
MPDSPAARWTIAWATRTVESEAASGSKQRRRLRGECSLRNEHLRTPAGCGFSCGIYPMPLRPRFADEDPLSAKWSHGCRHWQLSTRAHRVYAQRASDSLPLSLHVQRITARLAINAAMALTFVGAGHVAASGQREDAPLRQSAVSCRRREGAQGCRLLGESSG